MSLELKNRLNTILIVVCAFFAYLIMAGLLTQIGILIASLSKYFGISLPNAASLFSFLNIGCLGGTFVSMVIFEHLQIKRIYQFFYLPMLIAVGLMFVTQNEIVAACLLFVIGLSCGVGLSAGAVIIAKTFDGGHRASAFLGTDCAFSAAGAIFPGLTTYLIAQNLSWQNGLLMVMIPVLLVLVITLIATYPETRVVKEQVSSESVGPQSAPQKVKILSPRVLIAGLAVGLYLLSQQSFLTWAPTYLQDFFNLSPEDAGEVLKRYWSLSVVGLICAAVVVNKISVRKVLLTVCTLGTLITAALYLAPSAEVFLSLAFAYGFCTTCTYKIGISIGSEQIKNAPARLVTFLLVCGTVGSTLGPLLSSQLVRFTNSKAAILFTCLLFLSVLILFSLLLVKEKKAQKLEALGTC